MILKIYGYSDDLVEFELIDGQGKQVWSEEASGENCRFLISVADGPTLGVQAVFDNSFIPDSGWVLSVHHTGETADWPGEITVSRRDPDDPILNIELPSDRETQLREVPRYPEDGTEGLIDVLFSPVLKVITK